MQRMGTARVIILLALLCACQQNDWQTWTSATGRFSILAPAEMTVELHTLALATVAGPHSMVVAHAETKQANYSVAYGDYPTAQTGMAADATLAMARDWIMENTPGGTLWDERQIRLADTYPGLAFLVQPRDGERTSVVRLYLVDDRLYQLGVTMPNDDMDEPFVQRYLDSFALTTQP